MRNALLRSVVVGLLAVAPSPAFAWGIAAHRYIMAQAIERLPPELKPFFERNRDELVMRIVDPDLWRIVGWEEEDPNHFVNFGVPEYGSYPFVALPRELDGAIEKFGLVALRRNGLLPWRESEQFGNLRRAFAGFSSGSTVAPTNTVLFAAVAAHYLQDAYQPLHAVVNYDGQLTGQRGVHARFESALFERYGFRLSVKPGATAPISNPRDAAFEALLQSYQLVEPLLAADKEALAGRDSYDDEYFDRFFAKVQPLLERRLGEAISATASLIQGAWESAGKPAIRFDMPRAVQKVGAP
jgi:hypothetical protein